MKGIGVLRREIAEANGEEKREVAKEKEGNG